MYSYGPPHMAEQKQDDQLEHTYSSCVRIRDVALKTCQRRWMIGRSGERGSGISVLAAWHDDDDDDIKKTLKQKKIFFDINKPNKVMSSVIFFCVSKENKISIGLLHLFYMDEIKANIYASIYLD